jgi:hypothetical protein
MAAADPMDLASAVRTACIQAALDGYEQAQIAGLCQEGAWECAVDAMRKLDLKSIAGIDSCGNEAARATSSAYRSSK